MTTLPKPRKIHLAEAFEAFDETWAPKIVASYNGNDVRLVKTEGERVWHKPEETGELVEHPPSARNGVVKLLLIDPGGTPNIGDDATATRAVEL